MKPINSTAPAIKRGVATVSGMTEFLKAVKDPALDLDVKFMDLRPLTRITIKVDGCRKIRSVGGVVSTTAICVEGKGHLTLEGFEGEGIAAPSTDMHLVDCTFGAVESAATMSAMSCQLGALRIVGNAVITSCAVSRVSASLDCRITFRGCFLRMAEPGCITAHRGSMMFIECMFQGPERRWFCKWGGRRHLYLRERSLPEAVTKVDWEFHVYSSRCTFENVRNNLREAITIDRR